MPRKNYLAGGLEVEPVSSPPSGLAVNDIYLDDGTNTGSGLPGWRYLVSTGPDTWDDAGAIGGSTDTNAIHKTTADEFDTAALKGTPVNDDRVLIEDSADSLNKKYVTLGTLPGGSSLTIEEEGTPVDAATTVIDFTGAGATASQDSPGNVQVNIPGTDADAIHDNVTGEINALTDKASPVGADLLIIEDSAASFGKKKVSITNLPGGVDADAIHDNVAGEIAAISAKGTPTTSDYLVIEDAADSNNKKSITIGDIPSLGVDSNAVHDNTAAEISAVTEKVSPISADLLLIEDSADSNNKKRVQVGNLPTGSDADAIHDNVAAEINAITEKTTPVSADLILIEDSADSNNKKKVQVGNLPSGGGSSSVEIVGVTNETVVMGAAPVEVDIGSFTYDGSVGAGPDFIAIIEPSAAVSCEIRLYDRGPVAGPATTAQLVSKLTTSSAGLQTLSETLTETASPTFPDSNEIYNTNRMYVVRSYISGALGDSLWIGKVSFSGDLAAGTRGIQSNLWSPPSSAHTEDDEFETATIDSSWSVFSGTNLVSGSFSYDTVDAYDTTYTAGNALRVISSGVRRPSWLIMQPPQNNTLLVSKPYTFPTNALIVSRLRFSQRATETAANDGNIGISILSDSSGDPNYGNDRVTLWLKSGGANVVRAAIGSLVGGSFQGETTTDDVDRQGQALEYVALHKIGTDVHGWAGTASGNWIYIDSYSISAYTPAHLAIVIRDESTTAPGLMIGGVDFVRVYETDNFLF